MHQAGTSLRRAHILPQWIRAQDESYGYDSLNRLTSANLGPSSTQSYTYDANSNRTNATINGSSTTYNYPSSSHKLSSLTGATSKSFTYDNAGNTTASGSLTLVYDGRGRMKQAGTATYLVNGLGQRVRKNTGSDTYFAYDEAGHLIGEYDSSGNAIEETVWLGDLPVGILKPNGASFNAFYVWTDNLGSPRQVTDSSNVIRWTWDNNDPFGNNASNENPAGAGPFSYNVRFPGQYADLESGLSNNHFRDLDTGIGRFIQSDPDGVAAGLDTYGYVDSSPLGWIDVDGLARFTPGEMGGMIGRNNSSGYSNNLLLCLAWNESNFDPFLTSGTGPRGLMMMSGQAVNELNAHGFNFDQSSVDVDPEQKIGAGSAYLGLMRKRWKGKGKALEHYGTGKHYPANAIMKCEKCLARLPKCADPKKCLLVVHK